MNLTVLPTSDLRLSFIGDDGHTDRLFTLNSKFQCSAVEVSEIPADNSGRSFVIKIPGGRVFHFWCSEMSKLLGIELIGKVRMIYIMSVGMLMHRPFVNFYTHAKCRKLVLQKSEVKSYISFEV